MKKIITSIGRKTASQPTEYEFIKIATQRKLVTNGLDLGHYKRVEAGALGEMQFEQIMNQFGSPQWYFLQNIWFENYNTFECDYVLVTKHCVYVFEIKNYYGEFEYQNGQCKSRGVGITYNPINQAHNAMVHLKNLVKNYSAEIPIKGVLVFIGEHNKVCVHDDIDYIDIITRNEIYSYIQNMIQKDNASLTAINPKYLIEYLEPFEVKNPYLVNPYTSSDIMNLHAGLYCKMCSRELEMTRSLYIECSCGFQEYREHLIVRTACEYGVLTHGTNFVISDIQSFVGAFPSRVHMKNMLPKHFNVVPSEKILTLENYGRPLDKLTQHFTFELPNRMIIST